VTRILLFKYVYTDSYVAFLTKYILHEQLN